MTTVSTPPTFPPIGSPTFNGDAYSWAVFMANTYTGQINAVAGEVNANKVSADADAATATSKAAAAAASAASAASAPGTSATSVTSLTIGTGSKTLTIDTGKSLVVGMSVKVAYTTTPTNWMFGDVTAYNSGSGSLTVNVTLTNGSGTQSAWTVSLSGPTGGTATGTNTGDQTSIVGITGTMAQYNTSVTDGDFAYLSANTFTGAQNFADQQVSRATMLDCSMLVVDKGSVVGGTVAFDYTAGSVQTFTAGAATSWSFTNWPPTGTLGNLLVQVTNGGNYTQTISGVNWIKPDGTIATTLATYLAANSGRTALQTGGMDQLLFWTRDAGTTVYGKLV